MFINIVIKTKNKKSLILFSSFYYNLLKLNYNQNFLILKQTKQKIKIKKFIIPKSPHVHKKSKETFDYSIYSLKILIYTSEYMQLLKMLKKNKT